MKHLVVLALLGVACGKGETFHPLKVGDPAPPYAAVTVSGDTLSLREMRGNAVLINTWATWCSPCSAEMPGFQQLFTMFADSGLRVIGVSIDQTGADAKIHDFVLQHALRVHDVPRPGAAHRPSSARSASRNVSSRSQWYDRGAMDRTDRSHVRRRDRQSAGALRRAA